MTGLQGYRLDYILAEARHGNNIINVRTFKGIDGDTD